MYYIVFGLLYAISLLPLPILYLVSSFFYLITYYIAGYRKQVVFNNLAIAFPEKTAAERKVIAKQFYRDFCDNWIEAVKLLSISKKNMRRHITADLSALEAVYQTGKPCHILLGHQFNWEWGNAIVTLNGSYQLLAAYSPLSSKITDRLFLYLRERFGAVLLPFNDMRRAMMPFRHTQYALALMADQSPPNPAKSYWPLFFNRPTAFLKGPEKGAHLAKMPVVFVSLSKTKRGYYHLGTSLITSDASTLQDGELTKLYVQELENCIRKNPSLYLWSHKRWKHEWKEEYGK
ncbi:MAG: lysophospholipid acyltransferase family protein [Chitinophagaceae bacterium]